MSSFKGYHRDNYRQMCNYHQLWGSFIVIQPTYKNPVTNIIAHLYNHVFCMQKPFYRSNKRGSVTRSKWTFCLFLLAISK